jgi:hypothetical protein
MINILREVESAQNDYPQLELDTSYSADFTVNINEACFKLDSDVNL